MLEIRSANDRGLADFGWLKSRHTFSFGHYHDAAQQGFSDLLVINDDRVHPGRGFGTHPHRDMEIFSYVLEGALEHKDSLGTGSTIRPGDVQRMTAGTGVRHSEYNPQPDAPTHFLQIWILPERGGLEPGYEQKAFPADERRGKLRLVAAPDGRDGAVTVHQDARLYTTLLEPGESVTHDLAPGRHAWVQVARGGVTLGKETLAAGDGAALSDESRLTLRADEPSEVLVFDLA